MRELPGRRRSQAVTEREEQGLRRCPHPREGGQTMSTIRPAAEQAAEDGGDSVGSDAESPAAAAK